jgi:hypothetical protein
MAELNEPQKYLLPYIDKYRNLVKEIGDSIANYRDGGGISYLITQKEMDWLIFHFYPSLQNNLEKFLPYERAKDIQQTTKKAFHKVLSYLSDRAGYEKYKDGSVASQDMEILMDAYNAAGDILDAPKHKSEKESADSKVRTGKIMEAKYIVSLRKVFEEALKEFRKIDYKNSTINYMKAVFPAGITEQQRNNFWTNYLKGAGDDKRSWPEYTEYPIDSGKMVSGSLSGKNVTEGWFVIEPIIKKTIQRLLLCKFDPDNMPDSDTFFEKFAEDCKIIDEEKIDIERMTGSVYLWFEFLLKLAKEQGSFIDVGSFPNFTPPEIDYTVDFYCLKTDALDASIKALEYLLDKAEQKTRKDKNPDWPPFPLPDIYDYDDPKLICAAIDAIQKLRRNYIPEIIGFNKPQFKYALDVALSVRSEYPELKQVPLAKNPNYPTEQDFIALEQWFLDALTFAQAEIASGKARETRQNATPAKVISIKNFKGILGDVHQPENLQIGDHTSIHKHDRSEEKKKGIIWKILKIIVIIVATITFIGTIVGILAGLHELGLF